MKRIYLEPAGKVHPLFKELVLHPPEGYEFITEQTSWDRVVKLASGIDFVYSFQEKVSGKLVPVNLFKAYLERWKKIPDGTSLTFSTGHLVFRKEPWVVHPEFVTEFAGWNVRHLKKYKKLIESVLSSQYCKRIIVWSELVKKSILRNLDCARFEQKIDIVPLAVGKKNFIKNYGNKDKVKILFVGSATIPGQFAIKGGNEVLETIVELNKKHNNLDFVVRSDMPPQTKNKYGQIKNLRIIDKVIPWQMLEQEFQSTDIFLYPANCSPDTVILDAMSYELPVITVDAWANPELVEDGKTGFVVKKSERVQHLTENFIPNWASPANREAYRTADPKVVDELVERASILIKSKDLRKQMGKVGRQEINSGKFSIEQRNEKLKRIFDEATKKD